MEKKEKKVAKNFSSGAEKVEVVERKVEKEQKNGASQPKSTKTTKTTAKGEAALGGKYEDSTAVTPTQKEREEAKGRVETALKKKKEQANKKEAKAKRLAEKKAVKEKRLAEKKAKIEKRLAEKKAIAEKRAAEREAFVRERARRKANNRQKTERARKERRKKREENSQHREKGYGGWIAAVVALGATTLALATTVAVGGVELRGMQRGMTSMQRSTVYELTGVMEHVDDDLDRARISVSPSQQSRILTDLLVQARLAEADLEKLPVSCEKCRNVTEFINRIGMECERMLSKLRKGEELSERDLAVLDGLYKSNHAIRGDLEKLVSEMTDKDLMGYMKEGNGMISESLDKLEKFTLEENRAALEKRMEEMKGAGMERKQETPSENPKTIDTAKAEELCQTYFSKYKIGEYQCVGETVTRRYSAYNVQGYDESGNMLFAEIDRNNGNLLRFDYFEDCSAENFDMMNAERIAQEFLGELGYNDMTVSRFSTNGSSVDFAFVYEMDGVAYYPDEIRVKVCRSRGIVSGMDATKYLQNHREREAVSVKLNLETAQSKLCDKLTVESSRLAVVKTARGEKPAYEFLCFYDGEHYFVYLDANTGDEVAIVNVNNVW